MQLSFSSSSSSARIAMTVTVMAVGAVVTLLASPSLAIFAARAPDSLLLRVSVLDGKAYLEPIALLNGRMPIHYSSVPESEKSKNAFFKSRLSRGSEYRVLYGGAPAGTARITGEPEDTELVLTAPAQLAKAPTLSNEEAALATDSPRLGGKGMSRRTGTPEEKERMLALARATLQTKLPARSREHLRLNRMTLLTPREPGKKSLYIATFIAPPASQTMDEAYGFFMVAETDAAAPSGIKPTLTLFHKPDGWKTPSLVELVDTADLDGDGSPEIIVENIYFESYDFAIYTRGGNSGREWRRVYRGGGGGA